MILKERSDQTHEQLASCRKSLLAISLLSSTALPARTAPASSAPFFWTALGVPRDTVVREYMVSNQYLLAPDTIETTTADLQGAFGLAEPPDISSVKTIMTAKPETLEATFDKIDKTYGSFGNYLRDALKLSDSELTNLRQRLLEP